MSLRSIRNVVLILSLAVFGCLLLSQAALAGTSPGTAMVLSAILPGAGHMYAGETDAGWTLLGLYAGSMTLAVLYAPPWESEQPPDPYGMGLEEGTGTPSISKLLFVGSAAVAGITWIYAMVDAPKAVRRSVALVPLIDKDRVGLAVSVSF